MIKNIKAIFLFAILFSCITPALAQDVRPEFNPNILIQDTHFNDTQTLGGAQGIQKFLESKNSILANTSPDFLTRLNEPTDPYLKFALGDPGWNIGRLRNAAELIWDASLASGINPQVILVTLNKEQGLITSTNKTSNQIQRALNHAMGFDCPDNTGCGNLFPGFYYQLFGNVDTSNNRYLGAAKSLMKSFTTPGGRGPSINGVPAKVGDQVTIDNTIGGYPGILARQTITIGNLATAALYRYTPHVFNGNYNFWNFFTSWFKYPNGTLLSSPLDGLIYIIQDGERERVPNFVAINRGLNLSLAIKVSSNELNDYPLGHTYGPTDNTVVTTGNAFFVFQNDIMHPVTNFVLKQRKIDATNPLIVTTDDTNLFTPGPYLTPTNGSVLRGTTDVNVYLVENDVLKKFSPFTFRQQNAAKLMQKIADDEIALYPKQGYVIPLSGTLITTKNSDNLYVVNNGRRLPLTPELFKNLGYKQKDVVTLQTIEEIASIPLGPSATPAEGTYFSIGDSSEFFMFKNGTKHPIFPFVAKQRGMTPDYHFAASIVSGWADGIAIPPRDNTILKSDASPILYTVKDGQLRQLTPELIKNLGINTKKISVQPDYEIAAFAKNGYAEPAENTYFKVAETGELYVFQKHAKRHIYSLVAAQRGFTPDIVFKADVINGLPLDVPVAFRNGTLVKGSVNPTIYLASQGKMYPLSDKAFKLRGYKTKNIKTMPQTELDTFPKGNLIIK